MTAEATSEDSLNDGKGGGSLEETASTAHHKQERVAQGISSNHSRGARSSAESKPDEAVRRG